MGAKAPSKLNLRRPTYNCDSCKKKFLSTQALKSHQYCVHRMKGKNQKSEKAEQIKLPVKIRSSPPKSGVMIEKEKDIVQESSSSVGDITTKLSSGGSRRLQFECPQCLKLFNLYSPAFKHIQKFHCINVAGVKVDPSSPSIIRPTLAEFCNICQCRIRVKELHLCCDDFVDATLMLMQCKCTGCNQVFQNTQLLDLHVAGIHRDGLESMFFPSVKEFLQWKADIETETNDKYLMVQKHNLKNTRTFFCSHFFDTAKKDGVLAICPARIVIREFSKGIQVHFHKAHYGHSTQELKTSDKCAKYAITNLMDKVDGVDMTDDTDLYVQFKTFMDSIVIDAAKLKIDHLKILIGKALEMSTTIKVYAEEEDQDDSLNPTSIVHNKPMTDDEITEALDTVTQLMKKRRNVPDVSKSNKRQRTESPIQNMSVNKTTPNANQSKDATPKGLRTYRNINRMKTPTILNTFSLADEEKSTPKTKNTPISKTPDDDSPKVNQINQIVLSSTTISSFNDSYREFVDKNFKTDPGKTKSKIKVLSKNDINEKLEQNISNSKNANDMGTKTNSFNEDSLNNFKINKSLDSRKANKSVNKNNPPKILNMAFNNKPNLRKKVTAASKNKIDNKKKVMKTKIGQFKPSLSPKKSDANTSLKSKPSKIKTDFEYEVKEHSSLKSKPSKIKTDFEYEVKEHSSLKSKPSKIKTYFAYEVKEQDNDCNILILKI